MIAAVGCYGCWHVGRACVPSGGCGAGLCVRRPALGAADPLFGNCLTTNFQLSTPNHHRQDVLKAEYPKGVDVVYESVGGTYMCTAPVPHVLPLHAAWWPRDVAVHAHALAAHVARCSWLLCMHVPCACRSSIKHAPPLCVRHMRHAPAKGRPVAVPVPGLHPPSPFFSPPSRFPPSPLPPFPLPPSPLPPTPRLGADFRRHVHHCRGRAGSQGTTHHHRHDGLVR